ncbi:helix-turn-helix transcriptional regulator [uncultured Roseobacter sp.]|uniref:helix-turn-helix transcriptional regulator n=1 Tax=uncultured Roseobacter sp. TaxID=114847 RepID=UPI00261D2AF9|nr:helix-turn-helix transcriptional regulator [uncultured Roseobacter sp.]
MDNLQLVKLFESLMDVSTGKSNWQVPCDIIAKEMNATAFMVYEFDVETRSAPFFRGSSAIHNEISTFRKVLEDGKAKEDEKGYQTILNAKPGVVLSERQLFRVSKHDPLPKNSYRDAMLAATGAVSRHAMRLNDSGPFADIAVSHDQRNTPDKQRNFKNYGSVLFPLLSKTLESARVFKSLASTYANLLNLFDVLHFGAVFCDERGRISLGNRRFHEMASEDDGFKVLGGSIVTSIPKAETALRNLLAASFSPNSPANELTLVLPRRSGKLPLIIRSLPVKERQLQKETAALLVCLDPQDRDQVNAKGLLEFDLLTDAEAEVCNLLIQGLTAREISERRSTSVETTRTQVKSTQAKLFCRNRLDLLRLAIATSQLATNGRSIPHSGDDRPE